MRAFRRLRSWPCWLALLLLSGCMFHRLGRDLAQAREHAVLSGFVRTEHPGDLPILVLVYSGDTGHERLVDYFVMAGAGRYYFVVPAGSYRLAAFVDVNRNFTYEPGVDPSALLHAGEPLRVAGAATLDGLDIEVRDASAERIPFAFSAANGEGLAEGSQPDLRFVGTVTRIDDPRFSDENAHRGLWQPVEFVRQVGAGVYFLEPYDPKKIPVLLVHGALGHPGDFAAIVAALDRRRFQPWLAYYPTATRLDATTMALDRWMEQLYVRHRYRRLAVVAHSMGGLIARAFIDRLLRGEAVRSRPRAAPLRERVDSLGRKRPRAARRRPVARRRPLLVRRGARKPVPPLPPRAGTAADGRLRRPVQLLGQLAPHVQPAE